MLKVNSVSKIFLVNKNKKSFLNFITNLFDTREKFVALKNINLSFENKEVIGLVGKNGSGKSTLLKIIAGILKPTEGRVVLGGDVVYLSGFYNGINKNLSMRDNIYIIGTLNGLSNYEISEKIKDILNFSELNDFIDIPIHKFSNGMLMRAAFSITIFTLPFSPDILLLDEILGGALDNFFKEKATAKIQEYIDSAKLVIIASHNLNYLSKNCSKVVWLERGSVKMFGNSNEILEKYSNCDTD